MMERVTSGAPWARVLRVVLVFTLVFWSTFNVEALAFAAMTLDAGSDREAGTLSDLDIWEVDKADATRVASFVRDVLDTASDQKQTAAVNVKIGETTQFVAVPTWLAAPSSDSSGSAEPSGSSESPDPSDPAGPSDSSEPSDSGDSQNSGGNPEGGSGNGDGGGADSGGGANVDEGNGGGASGESGGESGGGSEAGGGDSPDNQAIPGAEADAMSTQSSDDGPFWLPRAYADEGSLSTQADGVKDGPVPETPDDVAVAEFVEWKVSDEKIATLTEGKGVVSLTGIAAGKVTVTCSLKSAAASLPAPSFAADYPDKPFEVSFDVTVVDEDKPYVRAISLYLPDGTLHQDVETPVAIDEKALPYSLRAQVKIRDRSSSEDDETTYDCTPSKGLAELTANRFSNLEWHVENSDGTAASEGDIKVEDGAITLLKGDGTYTVWCVSPDGPPESPNGETKTYIKVRSSSAKANIQGDPNPQSTLTVDIDVPEPVNPLLGTGAEDDGAGAGGSGAAAGAASGTQSGSSANNASGSGDNATGSGDGTGNGAGNGSGNGSGGGAGNGGITTQADGDGEAAGNGAGNGAGGNAGGGAGNGAGNNAGNGNADSGTANAGSGSGGQAATGGAGEADAGDSNGAGSSASAPKTLKSTSKTYDYERGDLEPFTIKNADGQPDEYVMSSPGGQLAVKGSGPTLAALIYDAADPDGELGLSPAANPIDIESVEFVIAGGKSIVVPWSDLVASSAPNNVILASRSLVVENGGGGLSVQAEDEGGTEADAGTAGDAGSNAGSTDGSRPGSDAHAGSGANAGGAGAGSDANATAGGTSGGESGATSGSGSGSEAGTGAGAGSAAGGSAALAGADDLLPNTRFRLLYNGGTGALANPDDFRYINRVIVHVKGEVVEEPEPVDDSRPRIAYTPVRKGETAYLIPQFTLPDAINEGSVQFHYEWQWAKGAEVAETDSSAGASGSQAQAASADSTWSEDTADWKPVSTAATDRDKGQQLEVLTNDESIGSYRRFILHITQIDGATGEETTQEAVSLPCKIEVGSGFRVKLDYVPPIAGDVAVFTAIPEIDPDDDEKIDVDQIYYEWQMSTDYCQTWVGEGDPLWPTLLKQQSGVQSTTLRIPTKPIEPKSSESDKDDGDADASDDGDEGGDAGEGDAGQGAVQLTWIRVVAHHNGKKTPSDPAPLTVHVGDTSGGKKADEIQEALDKGSDAEDEPEKSDESAEKAEPSTGGQSSPRPSRSRTQVTELDRIVFEEPVPVDVGTEPQPAPEPEVQMPSQIYVNDAVADQIVEQEQTAQEQAKAQPGARWTELSSINPTDEDVRNILAVNPLAPFAAPLALGLTAAGAVEKLLGFRRQTR